MQDDLSRADLSASLVSRIRDLIVSGELPAGERINEVHLATRLGVSRTPLREALSALGGEGAIVVVARRGFFVMALSMEEVMQLYPLRAILDPAALRLAGVPSRESIERLRTLNHRFVRARDSLKAIDLDDRWHLELLAGCPNTILLDLIRQFMRRTRRYEVGLMRARRQVGQSGACHEAIIAALEAGDLDSACAALEGNMRSGEAPILEWLQAREKGEAA